MKNSTMMLVIAGAAVGAYFLLKRKRGPRISGPAVTAVNAQGQAVQTYYRLTGASAADMNALKAVSLNRPGDTGVYVTSPYSVFA